MRHSWPTPGLPLLLLVLLAGTLSSTLASAQDPGIGEAVADETYLLPPSHPGVGDDVALQAVTLLEQALQKSTALQLSSYRDLRVAAERKAQQEALGACEAAGNCVDVLTDGITAPRVLRLTLGKVGDELVLTLTLIETNTATVLAKTSTTCRPGDVPSAVSTLVDGIYGQGSKQQTFQLPKGPMSFAVMDFTTAGIDAEISQSLATVLSSEIRKIEGASVISKEDIRAMIDLEAQKSALGCADESCLAELGDALGVERLVVGSVGKVGSTYVVGLRLINTTDSSVENRVTESFDGQESQLIPAVVYASRKLLGIIDNTAGNMLVSSAQTGAEVFVDGKRIGELPLAPLQNLKPGRHEVRVRLDHYHDYRGEVYVKPGGTLNLWVELERTPDRWYESWVFWSVSSAVVVGTVAVVGAIGGTAGFLWWDAENRLHPIDVTVPVPTSGGQQ